MEEVLSSSYMASTIYLYISMLTKQRRSTLMEPLAAPSNDCILSSFHSLPLGWLSHISTNGKAMVKAGKMLIVIRDAEGRDDLIAEGFQVFGEHRVILRRTYLDGHAQASDFSLDQEDWMGC
jgi:hypothetical protein